MGCGGEVGAPPTGATSDRVSGSFASRVVSFRPGAGSGFGQDSLPEVVLGAPHGGRAGTGSLDVLALGVGGEIILGFAGTIVDGPGVDFIVFENAFQVSGGAAIFREPAEVAVSDDGATWTVFPCDPGDLPHSRCAGLTPTLSSPENGISPVDPTVAGGDGFDLGEIAVASVRFVRIRDRAASSAAAAPSAGFDLDAISIVHLSAEPP